MRGCYRGVHGLASAQRSGFRDCTLSPQSEEFLSNSIQASNIYLTKRLINDNVNNR